MLWIYKCPCGKSIEPIQACRYTVHSSVAGQGFHMYEGSQVGQRDSTLSCIGLGGQIRHKTKYNGNRFPNRNFQDERRSKRKWRNYFPSDHLRSLHFEQNMGKCGDLVVSQYLTQHVGEFPTLEGLWCWGNWVYTGPGLASLSLLNSTRYRLGNSMSDNLVWTDESLSLHQSQPWKLQDSQQVVYLSWGLKLVW